MRCSADSSSESWWSTSLDIVSNCFGEFDSKRLMSPQLPSGRLNLGGDLLAAKSVTRLKAGRSALLNSATKPEVVACMPDAASFIRPSQSREAAKTALPPECAGPLWREGYTLAKLPPVGNLMLKMFSVRERRLFASP
jgi:hypothetical protein